MDSKIYLDYMATTPIDDKVIGIMLQYMGFNSAFGNASSAHSYGLDARAAVEHARAQIAKALNTISNSILFTSGATEANNLAIVGAARFYKRQGKHLITMATEHDSVLQSMRALEKEGFDVTYLKPKQDGLLDLDLLVSNLRPDTILVSIMHANHETGVIQDIKAIGDILSARGILYHVDASQSFGKLVINLNELSIDLMSFSAHKCYGPKGVGALYLRQNPKLQLEPLSFGGGQEFNVRSGTLATHQIVGMGAAFELISSLRQEEQERILKLRNTLWAQLAKYEKVQLNGSLSQRLGSNLNIYIEGISKDEWLKILPNIAFSFQSACRTKESGGSTVLKAMGYDDDRARNSIRLALGRFTTQEDIAYILTKISARI